MHFTDHAWLVKLGLLRCIYTSLFPEEEEEEEEEDEEEVGRRR